MGEVVGRRYKGGLRGVGNQSRGLWVITWAIVRNPLTARHGMGVGLGWAVTKVYDPGVEHVSREAPS